MDNTKLVGTCNTCFYIDEEDNETCLRSGLNYIDHRKAVAFGDESAISMCNADFSGYVSQTHNIDLIRDKAADEDKGDIENNKVEREIMFRRYFDQRSNIADAATVVSDGEGLHNHRKKIMEEQKKKILEHRKEVYARQAKRRFTLGLFFIILSIISYLYFGV